MDSNTNDMEIQALTDVDSLKIGAKQRLCKDKAVSQSSS